MKKCIITTIVLLSALTLSAQESTPLTLGEGLEIRLSSDFVSSYVWRGQDLGSAAVQPTLGIEYKGLSLTAWGSYGLVDKDDAKEFDLTLDYTIGGFNISVTDYWFNSPEERYFLYAAHRTSHVFEANIGYDFGPVAFAWYTNFAGNDGVNKNGKRAYSSYFEAVVPFCLSGVDFTATAGAVPYATDFYGTSGFAVTNLSLRATKDIKVTDRFSIPIFGEVTGNPCSRKAFMVFGFTLQP